MEAAHALINRMGFPNEGAATIAAHLSYRGVCGVNVGKGSLTALNDAADDYVERLRIVAPVADYVAINVSSPNTKTSAVCSRSISFGQCCTQCSRNGSACAVPLN